MKKAKVMLTAIAVFAVVGGALAVKASRFGSTIFAATTSGGAATVTLQNRALGPGANQSVGYFTTSAGAIVTATTFAHDQQ